MIKPVNTHKIEWSGLSKKTEECIFYCIISPFYFMLHIQFEFKSTVLYNWSSVLMAESDLTHFGRLHGSQKNPYI